jgi:nucleotide-binding universal stress UspA family protein
MNASIAFNSLLVPTDFSPPADEALRWALKLADGEEPVVILLHVIDPSLVDFVASHQFASHEVAQRTMREHAEKRLQELKHAAPAEITVDTLISEGLPFLEILRKADDFAVDAIVLGKIGTRGPVEKLLFGSTAEKVLRGSRRPVIVLPATSPE